MGYYSSMVVDQCEGQLNQERLEEMRMFYKKTDFSVFALVEVVQRDNCVDLKIEDNDYYQKFYYDEVFAAWLSYVLEEGTLVILFYGEDGEDWGYKIVPGKVTTMQQIWEDSDEMAVGEAERADSVGEAIKLFKNGGYTYYVSVSEFGGTLIRRHNDDAG